jgi:pyridoxamine 5'-phosphate oxidase
MKHHPLDERTIDRDPIAQFRRWYEEAKRSEAMPEAMALATSTLGGSPSVRMVLLKQADNAGFVFYTNYGSRKGRELAMNTRAALLFHWAQLERQVRIEGSVERVSEGESDEYFRSRSRESQLSAAISPQSAVVESREHLERMRDEFARRLGGTNPVPRPASWGGFRVKPATIEFWQGREGRLHDRIFYEARPDGSWVLRRLAP